MKKIININLSGRVIPIEDSAYESLQRYIESLRRYFAKEEGRDEIINDIESRIAELMNDKIRKGATAVTDTDIEEIISSMGRVEDFEAADAESETKTTTGQTADSNYQQSYEQPKRPKGRLYRDTSDKFLGGVCSGIANYLNFDPAVVRILFAIITFGGFGFGFLLYIILWMILPSRELENYGGKRFFRNPDDQMIGGVCGGLAAYFNKSSRNIRLIFAAPLILNIFFSVINGIFSIWHFDYSPVDIAFGSITSTFILAYIILWIVLPLAKTPYDKMEMRGEKVDVNRIRQNVQEGMGTFKDRAQAWGEEVKDSANRLGQRAREFSNTQGKTFASEAKPVASGIGHAIGVLFKAFFLFILGSVAFGLFVGLMMLVFGGGAMLWPLKQAVLEFALDGFWQNTFFWGTVIFFLIVPLIGFITWLIRRIMRVKSQRNYLGWTFGGLWTIGWLSLILLVSSLAKDFRMRRTVSTPVQVLQPVNNKMLVTVSEPEISYKGDLFFVDADNYGWDFTDDSLKLGNVKIDIISSNDSNYHVDVIRQSNGRTSAQATVLAQRIQYNIASRDSVLDLGSGYAIARKDKFRAQEIRVTIHVPVGKGIRFDNSLNKLHPYNVNVRIRRDRNRDWDVEDGYYFSYKRNVDYIMQANGELARVDGLDKEQSTTETIDTYRYGNDSSNGINRDSLDRILEEKRRQQQQAEEEIRRLEEIKRRRQGE
jgi:phage shock protein PspC (stress-responsive transcriptional regulator)